MVKREPEKNHQIAILRSDFSEFNPGKLLYGALLHGIKALKLEETGAGAVGDKLNWCAVRTLQTMRTLQTQPVRNAHPTNCFLFDCQGIAIYLWQIVYTILGDRSINVNFL